MTEIPIVTDIRELPEPACKWGFPWTQIETFMPATQVRRLEMWMNGQTQARGKVRPSPARRRRVVVIAPGRGAEGAGA